MATDSKAIQHPSFYFSEGDIVLSAPGDDMVPVMFRVHRVLLSQSSPVFAAMLALPAGDTQREEYDGAPSVSLFDNASNVEALLHVLYNPGLPVLKARDTNFYSVVYRLVEMARKYDVIGLYQSIISRLEDDWPKDIAEYWRFEADWRAATRDTTFGELNLDNNPQDPPAYLSFPDPATAIRLGVDYDVPSVLPAAFYVLSMTDASVGWRDEAEISRWAQRTSRYARWDILHPSERESAIQGREKLIEFVQRIGTIFEVRHNECASRYSLDEKDQSRCRVAAKRLSSRWSTQDRPGAIIDPIGGLATIYSGQDAWGICENCKKIVRQRISRMLREIWNGLPQTFNIST